MSKVLAVVLLFAPAILAQYQAVQLFNDKMACSGTPYEATYTQSASCTTLPCTYGTVEACVADVPPPTSTQFATTVYVAGTNGCVGTVSTQTSITLNSCFGPAPGYYSQYLYTAGATSITAYAQCDSQCSTCKTKTSIPLGCFGVESISVGTSA
eukprot:TRINITY_DN20042_c0_g1_i1.p1 TRINITY_DN20042_c0_g1~~TRINITY_DN20042_c0_g1_i1.p1  ORF type:complete len:179 (+),score=46.05 TRINITY_DN20042_c0_g1_i1:77-538(+)